MDQMILCYSAFLFTTLISKAPVNVGRTINKTDDVVLTPS